VRDDHRLDAELPRDPERLLDPEELSRVRERLVDPALRQTADSEVDEHREADQGGLVCEGHRRAERSWRFTCHTDTLA
jgi:hypothetical protein